MVSIRFVRNYTVKPTGPMYTAGDIIECTDESAEHFRRRGAAELVLSDSPPAPAAPRVRRKPPTNADRP